MLLAFFLSGIAHAQTGDSLRTDPAFVKLFRQPVQSAAQSTVRIQCDGKDTCMGVVVGSDGLILAKAHDLTGKISCKLGDGRQLDAKVVTVHEPHDFALLKIGADKLKPIEFADSQGVKPGTWVASAGAGGDPVAIGIVSVATRKVHEAYLGIQVEPGPHGLTVIGVYVKSAALKAGVQARDVLMRINQQKIADADHLQQILAERRPGDTITLTVGRAGVEHDLKLTLQSREQAGDFRSEFQNRLGSELSNRRSGYSVILQHDSVVKPTDCGGPLVDLKGRVIGINISRAGRVETWAVPSEVVRPLIEQLVQVKSKR